MPVVTFEPSGVARTHQSVAEDFDDGACYRCSDDWTQQRAAVALAVAAAGN